MPVSVTMPRLGESVSEGTVTRWLKKEGDSVEADEPLLEVSTDKVDTEIPAPAAGVLQAIRVGEDETVEVGVELAVIGDGADGGASAGGTTDAPAGDAPPQEAEAPAQQAEAPPAQAEPEPAQQAEPPQQSQPQPEPQQAEQAQPQPEPQQAQQAQPQQAQPQQAQPQQSTPASAGSNGEAAGAYLTPLVRRLAAEHSVDLATVSGTGVGGRIRKQDVLDAAAKAGGPSGSDASSGDASSGGDTAPTPDIDTPASGTSAPAAAKASQPVLAAADTKVRGRTEKLSRLRQVIAKRMVESLQVSAQLTTVVEADITAIARLRNRAKADFEAREGVKLSFLPFFALATVEALKQHPVVNSSIDVEEGTITYHDAEHLGIAVDTERGLLVPVIHNAGDLNLAGMARKIADLAARTRSNKVSPDELGGGTFTLTNTGSRGALFDTPIINQPQVGILGTGAVQRKPAVVDHPELGEVVAVRSTVYLALSYDHRIVDGADAARFLSTVRDRLQGGAFEGELGR